MKIDTRYTYGAGCSWHGPIAKVGKTAPTPVRMATIGGRQIPIGGHSLPCCPHCGGMLYEMPTEREWWLGARNHEKKGHLNYVVFLLWTAEQSRCWPSLRDAARAYEQESGRKVVFDL